MNINTTIPEYVTETVMNLRQTFTMLSNLPMPTIAVIEGAALGGGRFQLSIEFLNIEHLNLSIEHLNIEY